jgi:putative glutamine amidotransferase
MLAAMDRSDVARGPRIVVTVAASATSADPARAEQKNRLYAEALRRHGGEPVLIDTATPPEARAEALEGMAGLLLSGGADVDPARYDHGIAGSQATEPARDQLEEEAWSAAQRRSLPVLGICRGMQAINVFSGGSLLQDLPGHLGRTFGSGPPATHPLRLVPGTRLARILSPTNVRGGVLTVNSYHHQAVRPGDLAPGLLASAYAPSAIGQLVEGLESTEGQLVIGVQCHPERRETTPAAFDRLFGVFVDACRGAAGSEVRRHLTSSRQANR